VAEAVRLIGLSANPTYQAESAGHKSDETVAGSSCHFPAGTRRRNSSKKFSRKARRQTMAC
jgi:hypothetical protein